MYLYSTKTKSVDFRDYHYLHHEMFLPSRCFRAQKNIFYKDRYVDRCLIRLHTTASLQSVYILTRLITSDLSDRVGTRVTCIASALHQSCEAVIRSRLGDAVIHLGWRHSNKFGCRILSTAQRHWGYIKESSAAVARPCAVKGGAQVAQPELALLTGRSRASRQRRCRYAPAQLSVTGRWQRKKALL